MDDQQQQDFDHLPAVWTREEKRRVMGMVESHERATWLWATIGIWAKWLTVVAGAVAAVKLGFSDLVKSMVSK